MITRPPCVLTASGISLGLQVASSGRAGTSGRVALRVHLRQRGVRDLARVLPEEHGAVLRQDAAGAGGRRRCAFG